MRRLVVPLALAAVLAAPAREKKRVIEPSATIAGTVFRDSGFSLPGAKVTVEAQPESGSLRRKQKKVEVVSDARGEFAIRVPPVPMRYTVSVKAKGFKPDRKQVKIQGEERIDLFFRLEPESK